MASADRIFSSSLKSKSEVDRPLLMKLLAEQRLLSTQMQLSGSKKAGPGSLLKTENGKAQLRNM